MPKLPRRKAAIVLGMSQSELYHGLVSGRYPGYRVGGQHGRWIVSTEQVQARIDELMQANVKEPYAAEPARIRQVKP